MNLTIQALEIIYTTDILEGSPFSDQTHVWFNLFVNILLTGGVSLLGVLSNSVNMIVFYRQGPMSHSSITMLTGLAVSDFCLCLLGFYSSILYTIHTFYTDYSTTTWHVLLFDVITQSRPLNYITQITCWITTFLTFERVISVTFPFKVKAIFTPKRSLGLIVFIFIFFLFIHVPDLSEAKLKMYTRPVTNTSILSFKKTNLFTQIVHAIHFYTSPIFLTFSGIFIVVTSNVIIFWKVKLSYKFRKAKAHTNTLSSSPADAHTESKDETAPPGSKNTENKETKLLRMITVISVMFSVCYSMTVIHTVIFQLVYSIETAYLEVMDFLMYDIMMVFVYLNSGTNFFIFYNMSTRFREELHSLLGVGKGKD